jgi:hypothetical protein
MDEEEAPTGHWQISKNILRNGECIVLEVHNPLGENAPKRSIFCAKWRKEGHWLYDGSPTTRTEYKTVVKNCQTWPKMNYPYLVPENYEELHPKNGGSQWIGMRMDDGLGSWVDAEDSDDSDDSEDGEASGVEGKAKVPEKASGKEGMAKVPDKASGVEGKPKVPEKASGKEGMAKVPDKASGVEGKPKVPEEASSVMAKPKVPEEVSGKEASGVEGKPKVPDKAIAKKASGVRGKAKAPEEARGVQGKRKGKALEEATLPKRVRLPPQLFDANMKK